MAWSAPFPARLGRIEDVLHAHAARPGRDRSVRHTRRYLPTASDPGVDPRLIYYATETTDAEWRTERALITGVTQTRDWAGRILDHLRDAAGRGYAWSVEEDGPVVTETFYLFYHDPTPDTLAGSLDHLCGFPMAGFPSVEDWEEAYFLSVDVRAERIHEIKVYTTVRDTAAFRAAIDLALPDSVFARAGRVLLCRRLDPAGRLLSLKPEFFPAGAVRFLQDALSEAYGVDLHCPVTGLVNTHFALDFTPGGQLNKITGYLSPERSVMAEQLDGVAAIADAVPAWATRKPAWAVTGGLACSLHMLAGGRPELVRAGDRIALHSFEDQMLGAPVAGWARHEIPPGASRSQPVHHCEAEVDVLHGYLDDPLCPRPSDVVALAVDDMEIPVLRPEFLLVIKALPTLIPDDRDKEDVLRLLHGCDMDISYFETLLDRSAFRRLLPRVEGPDALGHGDALTAVAAKLRRKLSPGQREMVELLGAYDLLPLVRIEADRAHELSADYLRGLVERARLEYLTEEEQALALLYIAWSDPFLGQEQIIEAQETIYEASVGELGGFDRGFYLNCCVLWGRHMQPLMRTSVGDDVRLGLYQTPAMMPFMAQAGTLLRAA